MRALSLTAFCLSVLAGSPFLAPEQGDNVAQKPAGACDPWEPFECPDGTCIPIKYLCDGSADCPSGYDENSNMCTAAKRPPVEETANFLRALLNAHGKDFWAKIFGPKAKDSLAQMGGIGRVAVAMSESSSAEDFGSNLGLSEADVEHMKTVLAAIAQGDTAGIGGSEASDIEFYAQKLHDTGFF